MIRSPHEKGCEVLSVNHYNSNNGALQWLHTLGVTGYFPRKPYEVLALIGLKLKFGLLRSSVGMRAVRNGLISLNELEMALETPT